MVFQQESLKSFPQPIIPVGQRPHYCSLERARSVARFKLLFTHLFIVFIFQNSPFQFERFTDQGRR